MKAYKLNSSNRLLAEIFEGVLVDDERGILWSEQNLRSLGGKELILRTPSTLALEVGFFLLMALTATTGVPAALTYDRFIEKRMSEVFCKINKCVLPR